MRLRAARSIASRANVQEGAAVPREARANIGHHRRIAGRCEPPFFYWTELPGE